MSNVQVPFDEIAAQVLTDVTSDLLQFYQRALAAKGLVLTGELMRSFRYQIIQLAGQVVAEVQFADYGRMRDMRRLAYTKAGPPSDVMEAFVAKIGENNFAYVPGYKATRRVPTVTNAVARIAAGIGFSKRGKTVNRKFTGTWYNETTLNMVNVAKAKLADRLDEWFKAGMQQQAQSAD
ncbi:hypothetical protein [Fibrella aquatilis]|uniref:Uncharacterized protein n=1 Tax=Fibrella aquatilis TaxID=2817059 RepID=A0A939GAD6_9BACT|nr:hypothetical protein [Fibrella aquatilis]MBO0933935.1 hypothetical protein [Fibrella aquatilis]